MSVKSPRPPHPTGRDLESRLGPAGQVLWNCLKASVARQFPPLAEEWTWAGHAAGWSLRLKRKSRAVVYLTPYDGYFRASFALGEKAAAAARREKLPARALALIDAAPRYAEGRAVRIEVRRKSDLNVVEAIAIIKMAN